MTPEGQQGQPGPESRESSEGQLPVVLGRLHPLSPFVNGWKWFAAGLVIAGREALGEFDVALTIGLLVVALVAAVAYGLLTWRFTRYGFDGEDFRLDTGVLVRRSRRVRLDRLQAVDVVRPLLARALGLAELRLEVVGGGSSEAPLAYLSEPDAHRLRAELLARAAGLGSDEPEAPEAVLHRVPPVRLFLSGLLTIPVLLGAVALPVVLVTAVVLGEAGAVVFAIPALLAIGTPIVQQFIANFEFTLASSPDGLRLRRGLLETRAQTVPPGRVQAVRIVEPWLWRAFTRWVRLEVNVAGYGNDSDGDRAASALLLPVAPRHVALDVLRRVLPGVDVDALPLAPAPRRARRLDPFGWRVLGVGGDDRVLVARRGVLRRETDVMPHARAQSVRLVQGSLQRRLRLATVHLDSTPGPVHVSVAHRDIADAVELLDAEVRRARTARASDRPERWMTAGEVTERS